MGRSKRNSTLLDQVAHLRVLEAAYRDVRTGGGAAGVDGVSVEAFGGRLHPSLERLSGELRGGWYAPLPVRRVFVPKTDGGRRAIGIPCVRDRVVARACQRILTPRLDQRFCRGSFAYRKGRSARGAVDRIAKHLRAGANWAVVVDIKDFFPSINRALLQSFLEEILRDDPLVPVLGVIMAAGYVEQRQRHAPQGIEQGNPLSPLLSNVYLHPWDAALTERSARWVRFSDNAVIAVSTRSEAEQVLERVRDDLARLGLQLNQTKSAIHDTAQGFPFLGYHVSQEGVGPALQAIARLRDALERLSRDGPREPSAAVAKRRQVLQGWLNYYQNLRLIPVVDGYTLAAALEIAARRKDTVGAQALLRAEVERVPNPGELEAVRQAAERCGVALEGHNTQAGEEAWHAPPGVPRTAAADRLMRHTGPFSSLPGGSPLGQAGPDGGASASLEPLDSKGEPPGRRSVPAPLKRVSPTEHLQGGRGFQPRVKTGTYGVHCLGSHPQLRQPLMKGGRPARRLRHPLEKGGSPAGRFSPPLSGAVVAVDSGAHAQSDQEMAAVASGDSAEGLLLSGQLSEAYQQVVQAQDAARRQRAAETAHHHATGAEAVGPPRSTHNTLSNGSALRPASAEAVGPPRSTHHTHPPSSPPQATGPSTGVGDEMDREGVSHDPQDTTHRGEAWSDQKAQVGPMAARDTLEAGGDPMVPPAQAEAMRLGIRADPGAGWHSSQQERAPVPSVSSPEITIGIAGLTGLMARFRGARDSHASMGLKKDGSRTYAPVRSPLDEAQWRRHLAGEITLALAVHDQGRLHVGVLDVDISRPVFEQVRGDPVALQSLLARAHRFACVLWAVARGRGLDARLEDSGQKGRHLWLFFNPAAPTREVFLLLRSLVEEAGPPPEGIGVETIPASSRAPRSGMGALVTLPLGIHKESGRRSCFLEADGRLVTDMDLWVSEIHPCTAARGPEKKVRTPQDRPNPPATGDSRVAAALEGCAVLGRLVDKAGEIGHLGHHERMVLLCTLGHFGEPGARYLHRVIGRCGNYSRGVTQRHINKLKPSPVSCQRIREWLPETVKAVSCSCRFQVPKGAYPTPVLHTLEV